MESKASKERGEREQVAFLFEGEQGEEKEECGPEVELGGDPGDGFGAGSVEEEESGGGEGEERREVAAAREGVDQQAYGKVQERSRGRARGAAKAAMRASAA